jgi:type II secretory pathway component PulK
MKLSVSCSLSPVPCPLSALSSRRGAALVMAMVALLVVSLVAGALVRSLLTAYRQSHRYADQLQAQWLAEAGLARAAAKLSADASYQGEVWHASLAPGEENEAESGQVTITVEPATKKVTVESIYPIAETRRVLVHRESASSPTVSEP